MILCFGDIMKNDGRIIVWHRFVLLNVHLCRSFIRPNASSHETESTPHRTATYSWHTFQSQKKDHFQSHLVPVERRLDACCRSFAEQIKFPHRERATETFVRISNWDGRRKSSFFWASIQLECVLFTETSGAKASAFDSMEKISSVFDIYSREDVCVMIYVRED